MAAEREGGNPRFSGGGRLWKSGWRRRPPFTEICCFDGFNEASSLYYNDPTLAAMPGDSADGFFVGALVGVQTIVHGGEPIANRYTLGVGGWELQLVPGASAGTVAFRFTVYAGLGVTAATVVSSDVLLTGIDPATGNPSRTFVSVFAGRTPTVLDPPDGAAFITVRNLNSASTIVGSALTDPFAVGPVGMSVGADPTFGTQLNAPSCLAGLVGGTTGALDLSNTVDIRQTFEAWDVANRAAGQIVAVPDPVGVALANTNGWRAPAQHGDAPSPLSPFIGAVDLVNLAAPDPLSVECASPGVFYPDNALFPYTSTPESYTP